MSVKNQNEDISLIEIFLKKNEIKVPRNELNLQWNSHPNSGSLNALSDTLDHFRLENVVAEVNPDEETLDLLPECFMTVLLTNGRERIVVLTKTSNELIVYNKHNAKKKVELSEFLRVWTGIVILVEETDTAKVRIPNHNWLAGSAVGLLVLLYLVPIYYAGFLFSDYIYLFLSFAGLIIFGLIYRHEIGITSGIVDKICSSNASTSCEDVLSSPGATLFNGLKLTDIGIVYFAHLLGFWFCMSIGIDVTKTVPHILSVLAVPVTFFSIFYQGVKLKKWCPLCLVVVLILWSQTYVVFVDGFKLSSVELNLVGIYVEGLILLAVSMMWVVVKSRTAYKQNLANIQISYFKLRRNFELFKPAYLGAIQVKTEIPDLEEIVLGNQDKKAPLKVLLITNPQCFFCRETHKVLEKVLIQREDIQLIIRFNLVLKDPESNGVRIALRLIELYHLKTTKVFMEAIREAYSGIDAELWLKKWKEVVEAEVSMQVLSSQKAWCIEHEISFTPAVFVNTRQFPKNFDLSDLPYFVEDLIELGQPNQRESAAIH